MTPKLKDAFAKPVVPVMILLIAAAIIAFPQNSSCPRPAAQMVEVELDEQIGKVACGYEGVQVNIEYHKSVYRGADSCKYIVTDKRIIKHKEQEREDVYHYADVGEGDTILGNATGYGVHCLEGHEDPKHVADYIPVLTSENLTQDAIHLHHNGVFKKVS